MINKIINLVIAAIIFCAHPAGAKLFDMEEFYLDNGLQVIVIPNHKAPIVKQMLWYKAGSMDEEPGKGGIAHLLEHLMFRGTKKVPGSSFNDIIAQNGGDSNAFTSKDFTVYHEFVDVSRLEAAMALEADRMANLNISPEAFEGERKIVYHERQERITDNPPANFAEAIDRILWQNDSYSRPVSGTEQEIKNLQLEDAVSFYQRYYSPDNAVLILAGDINVPTAKALTQKYFGAVPRRNKVNDVKLGKNPDEHNLPENPVKRKERQQYRIESEMEKVQASRLMKLFVVPTLKESVKDAYALMIFSKYLGEGDNSYLNRQLVLKGKAAAASSFYDGLNRKAGFFGVVAIGLPSISDQVTEKLLNESILAALQSFDKETLNKEKHKMLSGLVYVRDNPEDAAMLAGNMIALGFKPDEIMAYEENIRSVTLEDIQSAVNKMLQESSSVSGIMRPLASEKEEH